MYVDLTSVLHRLLGIFKIRRPASAEPDRVFCTEVPESDPTHSIVVTWVNFFQTELMVEIDFKSRVRAIGKVLPMKLIKNTN